MPTNAVVGGDRRRDWYDARIWVGGRLVAPLPEQYHGKRSTYDYYGCRCDLCGKAASERPRRRSPIPAPRNSTVDSCPLTPESAATPTFLEPGPAQDWRE